MEDGAEHKKRHYTEPWFIFASTGLALCFLFRDANRYTTIVFPNNDSLLDVIVLACARLLPLVVLAIAYIKGMKHPLSSKEHTPTIPRVWRGFFIPYLSRFLIVTFIATLGIGVLFISAFGIHPTSEMITFGKILLGLGNTLFLVTYAEFLLPNGRTVTTSVFIAASYLYGILRILFGLLTPEISLILLVACPALSCFCLHEATRPRSIVFERFAPNIPSDNLKPNASSIGKGFMISLLVGIAGYTFLFSELHSLWSQVQTGDVVWSIVVQTTTGFGIVLGTFVISKLRDYLSVEHSSSYSMLLPSLCISILYLSTFLSDSWIAFYVIPLYASQRIVFFLIWNLALFYFFPKARIKMFCLGMLCLEGGVFVYHILSAIDSFFLPTDSIVSTVFLNAVLAFLVGKEVITWFLVEKRKAELAKREPTRKDEASLIPDRMVDTFDLVAESYKLTKRERELLPYLMLGRSPEYIGKALFIEPSTAKTHIKNIYRKVDVSKRTDLIFLIENWDFET